MPHASSPRRAAVWMIGALLSFSAMAVAGRELAGELSTFAILFFRSLIGLPVVLALAARHGGLQQLRSRRLPLHALRNLAHFGGQYGWFFGLGFLPLTEVFAIEFTTPLWTTLLAVLLLGERFTARRGIALLLGLIGVLIVLRPGANLIQPAALAVLAAAFGYAAAHTATKRLVTTESPYAILLYMTLMQLPLGLLPALSNWAWPQGAAWLWLALVGAAALSAHFCMSHALRLADASLVVPMDFLRLPLIGLIGALGYGEALDGWVLLGALVITAGILLNLQAPPRAAAPPA
jgi:drug/metabolite transporter (DMT)-like permease